ncbi:TIGR00180 family glycosyltransferase [Aestuariibacter sp. AA17]|uniref:TIGR00180 family glycosyltransferase n=1 Tax=Fluctibacter corallii TaxID=2984329 RepID=A0ABT3A9U4_9ALTE|nr:TIGR00180 family glycosyltransferase [Aestuariibacter sp. AA17]MCV2885446.1 TIGR00180 family glycosyltransferase [Aestuariibacter sp. AA17]
MKYAPELESLTIVIVTYQRHAFLKRQLDLLVNYNLNIVIIDGSENAFEYKFNDRIRYVHSPQTSMYDRMAMGFSKVDTAYTLSLADDDFVIIPALVKAIRFLDANCDYASYQGRVFAFNNYFPKSGIEYYEVGLNARDFSCEQDNLEARVCAFFQNYMHCVYSLQRSHVWKDLSCYVLPVLSEFEFAHCFRPAMFEFFCSFYLLVQGKHKVTDIEWLLRENIPVSSSRVDEADLNQKSLLSKGSEVFRVFANVLNNRASEYHISNALVEKAFIYYLDCHMPQGSTPTSQRYPDLNYFLKTLCSSVNITSEFESIDAHIQRHTESTNRWIQGRINSIESIYGCGWIESMKTRLAPQLDNRESLVIFGAGQHTKALLELGLFDDMTVSLTDNNASLWGSDLYGMRVISPKEITQYSDTVLISSQAYEREIATQLMQDVNEITLIKCYGTESE